MRNIPIFTTENGIASITLDQIPYNQNAFFTIQAVSAFPEFVEECIGFCKAAGAAHIYATGCEKLKSYEVYTHLLQMEILKENIICDTGELIAVNPASLSDWKDKYNQSMKNVPGAAIMDDRRANKAQELDKAYYVQYQGQTVGLGVVSRNTVEAIASLAPHMGLITLKTLSAKIEGDRFFLEVAENNLPAMKLYHKCKGQVVGNTLTWYKIF